MAMINTDKIRRIISLPLCTRIIGERQEYIIMHDKEGKTAFGKKKE